MNVFLVGAALNLIGSVSVAQQPADSSRLAITGYVEAYYTHDFTAPKTAQIFLKPMPV
jgi:hypothetical protein